RLSYASISVQILLDARPAAATLGVGDNRDRVPTTPSSPPSHCRSYLAHCSLPARSVMLSRRALLIGPVVPLLAAALAGCSDPYAGKMEVTGAVKLAGQPLKDGSIIFEPLDGQGTQSGAAITNGEYKIPRPNGLKPGKYLVKITAGDAKTPE